MWGLCTPGRGFWSGCMGGSRTWKLVGLLVAVAVVFFILGYLVVSRFIG